MSTFRKLYDFINSHASHVLFTYHGKNCGIDPFSDSEIEVWCGDKAETMTSIEQVFNAPFFDGKCLKDICDGVEFDY